ncbi:MAG: hypothetical protein D6722_09525 [Bacteroidetes bacterium]|nr:MAG: hypothetical protein D6722_09525 [Bacteroidota bacterium]
MKTAIIFLLCALGGPHLSTQWFGQEITDDAFTAISIPEEYQSLQPNGDVEILEIRIETPQGESFVGKIRFEIPEGEEAKLISCKISTSLLEQSGLSPDFWTDSFPNPESAYLNMGDCLSKCQGASRPRLCKASCWFALIAEIATPFIIALI